MAPRSRQYQRAVFPLALLSLCGLQFVSIVGMRGWHGAVVAATTFDFYLLDSCSLLDAGTCYFRLVEMHRSNCLNCKFKYIYSSIK